MGKTNSRLNAALVPPSKASTQDPKKLFARNELHPRTKLKNIYSLTKYPPPNNVKFTVFGIQSKITRQAKKLGNTANNEEGGKK